MHVPTLIDVTGIPEPTAHTIRDGRVVLGAATPFQRFINDQALAEAMPSMDLCAMRFADDQIRD